jgi:hypothetical protein
MGMHPYTSYNYGVELSVEATNNLLLTLYPQFSDINDFWDDEPLYSRQDFNTLFPGLPVDFNITALALEEYAGNGRGDEPYMFGIDLSDVNKKTLFSDKFETEYKDVFAKFIAPVLAKHGITQEPYFLELDQIG